MTTIEGRPVRVAILSFAHLHAHGYAACLKANPDAELVLIADDDTERGAAMAEQYGVAFVADYRDAVVRDDIDAVVVCSENVRHKEMTIAAAKAGKHVLCEKPIATNVEDALAMIAACRDNQVKLQIAFPVRFNSATLGLKQALDHGAIGAPLIIAARNPGTCPQSWFVQPELSGGGAVIDHTVHVVDTLRWMLGVEVDEVYAEIDTRIYDFAADDTGLLMMKLSNGIPVSLDTSWSRPANNPIWGGVMIEMVGEKGVLSLDAFRANIELIEIQGPSNTTVPVEASGDPEMIDAFIQAVRRDGETAPNGEDGLRAMEVALAAYESATMHQPVTIARAAVA
ncbi:MAG: Gfo/Idh/MocA family oxidoreductase [Thermomicrobiales bacterium]